MGSRGRLALTVVAALTLPASAGAALPQQSGVVDLLTQANIQIDGPAPNGSASEGLAAAGDVNDDGIGDIIVGTPGTPGSAYVVFGQPDLTGVDLAALGSRGFRIDGPGGNDGVGIAVGAAGDVNGDGLADVIVGAQGVNTFTGAAYVVFGKATTSSVSLAALGAGGFRIDGAAMNDVAGSSVAGAGDVNHDGLADVVVGAPGASNNARATSGSAYVVFGKASSTTVSLAALGAGGYRIDGAAAGDIAGKSVAGVGDVNGDGVPDVAVGAPDAAANGRGDSGAAYVVFGKSSTGTIDLASLGAGGIRIDGAAAADNAGYRVAGTDFNGDGRQDAIVGALNASPRGRAFAGSTFVALGFGTPALAYATGVSGVVGRPIAPVAPTTVARTGPALFSVTPALPAGLALDPATGAISGTPTRAEARTAHTVTMTDLAGAASAAVSVTVARDDRRDRRQPQRRTPKDGELHGRAPATALDAGG